jgi:energy-coupling factor transporter ATP-binding protein EcfA2
MQNILVDPARITIFAGHYGSGKTTVAVNYAMLLARADPRVALCDMDVVNPYFRTADCARALAGAGVELISSPYANTNVELYLPPERALRAFDDPSLTSVIDLGGDDCGVMALGRYAARIRGRGDVALLMVVNACRPLTRDAASLREIKSEIEAAGHVPFTGLVNNTNLGAETTQDIVAASFPLMRELRDALALPIVMTAVREDIPLAVPEDMGPRFGVKCYENRFGV